MNEWMIMKKVKPLFQKIDHWKFWSQKMSSNESDRSENAIFRPRYIVSEGTNQQFEITGPISRKLYLSSTEFIFLKIFWASVFDSHFGSMRLKNFVNSYNIQLDSTYANGLMKIIWASGQIIWITWFKVWTWNVMDWYSNRLAFRLKNLIVSMKSRS